MAGDITSRYIYKKVRGKKKISHTKYPSKKITKNEDKVKTRKLSS